MGVYKAKRAGRIHTDPATGLYDFDRCDAEWKKNTRPMPEGFGRKQSVSKRAKRLKGVLVERDTSEPAHSQHNLRLPLSSAAQAQAKQETEDVRQRLLDEDFHGPDLTIESEANIFKADQSTARTEIERYKAAQARLDYEKDLGKLVPREQVEREWSAILSKIRTRVLMLPDTLVERVGLEHRQFIEKEVRQALTDLSQTQVVDDAGNENANDAQQAA